MTIVVSLLLLGIAFYLLAVITEEFFVPAIDKLADKLKLSSDASGATLLAMGSSAPEFFTSLIAVLGLASGGHADIGAGTIVGSAIFNVLVIVGVTALFKTVTLQWKPVLRDQVFYIVTILLLFAVFWDGRIVLYEALLFLVTYVIYVFAVINWKKWFSYKEISLSNDVPPNKRGLQGLVIRSIGYLLPNIHKHPKRYMITFGLSIVCIAGLSWILVEQIITLADVLRINPTFLALTVLAAGTSIPDLIGSVVVAKQGRGDMAVSNAIGSNIFDVLFGLGVPWTIALLIQADSIAVSTENLSSSIFLLFATVLAILLLLVARRWRLGNKSGLVLIALYIGYCIYIAFSVIN